MAATSSRSAADPARHRSPNLVAVAGVFVGLFVASLVVSTAMAGGEHFPSVFAPADASARYFAENGAAVRLMALLQFGAAVPLGIFAASVSSRLQFLGMRVAGVNIALFGGIAAAVFGGFSACVTWVLGQPGVADAPGVVRALHLLCFAAGGPGFVVPFGLLIAGVAVVAGLQGFAPRWLMWAGLGIAAVAELSTFVLAVPAAALLLPIARFAGFLWIIAVSVVLPKRKGEGR